MDVWRWASNSFVNRIKAFMKDPREPSRPFCLQHTPRRLHLRSRRRLPLEPNLNKYLGLTASRTSLRYFVGVTRTDLDIHHSMLFVTPTEQTVWDCESCVGILESQKRRYGRTESYGLFCKGLDNKVFGSRGKSRIFCRTFFILTSNSRQSSCLSLLEC